MNNIISICISMLFFAITHSVNAKNSELHFSQITTKDGLSQNTVRDILQDKKGFIWAGTLDGLNRYDGYQIVTYKPQIGNPKSLIDHRIKNLFEDRNGYLWIKTYKNVFCCYDPVTESFIDYQQNIPEKSQMYYTYYYEANNGDIWLWGNTNGCLRIRKTRQGFTSKSFLTDIPSDNKRNGRFLFEDSKGSIWYGGESGLYKISEDKTERFFNKHSIYHMTKAVESNGKIYFSTEQAGILIYDIKRKIFEANTIQQASPILTDMAKTKIDQLLVVTRSSGVQFFNTRNSEYTTPGWAKDADLRGNIQFIIDKEQNIWIFNHTGHMWYYNIQSSEVKKLQLIPQNIINIIDEERYNVFIDSKDIIWITTYGNGLFSYDPKSEHLQNYKYRLGENSLSSDYLLSITEDKFGNLWLGSEYAGIIKAVKPNYDIQYIRPENKISIGKNNSVKTIYEDSNNNIWVGTKNGSLYVYDHQIKTIKHIFEDLNPYTITENKKAGMWVGTKGNGLYLFDTKTFKLIAHYKNEAGKPNSLSSNSIFSLLIDNKNRLWVGSFGGGINLLKEDKGTSSFIQLFNQEGNRRYIRTIYQDSKGLIWVGTSDGIIKFKPENIIANPLDFIAYKLNLQKENTLSSNDVKTIYEDEDGQIWIGTAGGGLNKYLGDINGEGMFEFFTTTNGLSGDIVSGILEDENHQLWISSENGISKFDKKYNSFTNFHFSENTYGNHFNENANLKCMNGNMFWGSLDGLLIFNPKSFVAEKNTPPVTFTNFFLYDQKAEVGNSNSPLNKSISFSDKINLSYKQNTFTIQFASLTLRSPEKNLYSYMLENYDKKWSTPKHDNSATYKNLPAGKYIFKVRGANSDGVWSDKITQIEVEVTPPFWKSTYAYILYSLLLIIALYFAFRLIYKFGKLNNAVQVEKQLTNHKLRFFTNISHEFRTPLTLIQGAMENMNGQSDIPDNIKKQLNILGRNSNILSRLIDQLLEFRKLQNNVLTLDLEEIDLIEFIQEIYSGFQEIAERKNITYTLNTQSEYLKMYIDRRKVDKIIYNLLSNAFKFTAKDGFIEISINVNQNNETCTISVKDNGIGIDKDKQHLLFSRFMQINFSSSGTGIGLSLVKEFVEAHKGKIWYENNTNGGSIFNVEFSTSKEVYKGENFITPPIPDIISDINNKNQISKEQPYDSLPEINESTLSNYKMLIIDDNDDIRDFLIDEFSRYFMVDSAENGKQGLQKAIETNPDLIICDVMMPEMDGFEVTRQLKHEFQTCHIPIILLTAHSSIEHQLEGIESGADAYIMKPFSIKYLTTRVFKLIEQREQLKKRFSNEYVLDGNLITATDKDKEFFEMIDRILEQNISNSEFSVDRFAELSKLRRTIFYKKVKGITGFSPNELIKIKRLKKAAEMLLTGEFTVSEISYKVGFEDPFYFSKCFKAQYNCSPSKYGQPKEEPKSVED